MKLLLAIFMMSTSLHAAVQWPQIDVADRDKAFMVGYASASLYDVYVYSTGRQNISMSKALLVYVGSHEAYEMTKDGKLERYLLWKFGLGLAGGFASAYHSADRDNRQIKFEEIVFGGLGGLTCIVIHF